VLRQQRRKAAALATWAQVAPAEFLDEFGAGAHDAVAPFDPDSLEGTPGGAC
jgi:hypothetical protein